MRLWWMRKRKADREQDFRDWLVRNRDDIERVFRDVAPEGEEWRAEESLRRMYEEHGVPPKDD